jgi:hypothetical protein
MGASNIMLSAAIAVFAIALVLWFAQLGRGAHATTDMQRNIEMAAESRALCEKWGMPVDSQKRVDCLADIQAVRTHQWERIMQDIDY